MNSPWARPSMKADVESFLQSLYEFRHRLSMISQRQPEILSLTLDQSLYIAVVFQLRSELDLMQQMDMDLPKAYERWQFSFCGITIRAHRDASNFAHPSIIINPDGSAEQLRG